jgi:hypothetical protein
VAWWCCVPTTLRLDGTIASDGGNGGSFGGGGSGGSVHLTLGDLQGIGSIRANGGRGGTLSGGGGGGRVFLRVPSLAAEIRNRITALGAGSVDLGTTASRGGNGTVQIEAGNGSAR